MFKRKKETRRNNWTKITYYSPQIRKITNLFKHINIGIALDNTKTF